MTCSTTPTAALEPLTFTASPDNQQVLLGSLSDPAHPTTLCTINHGYQARFISPTEISYLTNTSSNDPIHGTTQITRMNLTDMTARTVLTVTGDVMDHAWSPNGSALAYLLYTQDANGAANQAMLNVSGTEPLVLTRQIPLLGRDGSINDQILVRFSHDGKFVLMVDTWVAGVAPATPLEAAMQVHSVPDAGLVWVPPAALAASGKKIAFVTMAAWSHQSDRLLYRDPAGVHAWDPSGTDTTLAAGLAWYSPSVSPDDRLVAYSVGIEFGGQPHIEVRDLVSGSVKVLPGALGQPLLLSDDLLIEAHLAPSQTMGPPFVGTGYFLLKLSTGAEAAIPGFSPPYDVWPR